MPLSPEDLQQIAARTLAHYEQHAQSYWEGTRGHDVSQNIAALLKHIPGPPPFDLLDFGCGPWRDLHTFKALGHRAVGLEGAPSAAALARCEPSGAWRCLTMHWIGKHGQKGFNIHPSHFRADAACRPVGQTTTQKSEPNTGKPYRS